MRWRELALAAWIVAAGCGPTLIWSGRSADRSRTIEVVEEGGRTYVVVDGKRRAAYRGISAQSLALAGDHIAFAARIASRWVVVFDGKHGESWDSVGPIVLTPAGRIAYAAERAGGWHVVTDGVVGPRFDAILAGTLMFGPEGKQVAYVGTRDGRVHAVIDGRLGPTFDGIGQLTLAADGRVAYAARRLLDAYVVVGEQPSQRWSAVSKLQLAPNGRTVYAASDGTDWRVVIDGQLGPALDVVRRIVVRDDGKHVAWIGRYARLFVLALDNAPIAAWPALDPSKVTFRASAIGHGVGLAYVAPVETGGERLVVDGTPGAVYDEVRTPVWSRDGRIAYAARRARTWWFVLDGQEIASGTWISDPVFSRDGQRVAYVKREGKASFVVVDGRDHRFDLVFEDTLTFAADGRRWAVVAGDLAREKLYITLDGKTRIELPSIEIYSSAARAAKSDDLLRTWTQIEVDRPRS